MPCGTVLAGSNALLREALASVLTTAGFEVVASRACVDDHVVSLLTRENAVLLIIDVGDDFGAAIRQIEHFKRECPAGRVVVLAHRHLFPEVMSAFRAGANAYLVDIKTCEAFIKSLKLVILGGTVLPSTVLSAIFDLERDRPDSRDDDGGDDDQDRFDTSDGDDPLDDHGTMHELSQDNTSCAPRLSDRQKSILSCLIEGDSNKIIARKMNITDATVKVHVKAILRRIRVHNRTQAAIWGMNSGLFHPATDAGRSAQASPSDAGPSDLDAADVLPSRLTNGSSPARKAS